MAWAWLTLDCCVSKETGNNYSSRYPDFSILFDFLFADLKFVAKLRVLVLFFFSLLIAVLTIKVLKSMVVCRLCSVNSSRARVLGRLTCNE